MTHFRYLAPVVGFLIVLASSEYASAKKGNLGAETLELPQERVPGQALVKFADEDIEDDAIENVLRDIQEEHGITLTLIRPALLGWGLFKSKKRVHKSLLMRKKRCLSLRPLEMQTKSGTPLPIGGTAGTQTRTTRVILICGTFNPLESQVRGMCPPVLRLSVLVWWIRVPSAIMQTSHLKMWLDTISFRTQRLPVMAMVATPTIQTLVTVLTVALVIKVIHGTEPTWLERFSRVPIMVKASLV